MIDIYSEFVRAQRLRNPSLQSLHTFLTEPGKPRYPPRLATIDFFAKNKEPARTDWNAPTRSQTVGVITGHGGHADPDKVGRILIIENIDSETMSLLGTHFKVNPLFFASHIHSPWREISSASPNISSLPSIRKRQKFRTFPYQHALLFPEIDTADYVLLQQSNIPRKVVVFPSSEGKRLGVAQRCCSVLFLDTSDHGWLGIVLTDPPPGGTYLSFRRDGEKLITTPSLSLFGGVDDFLQSFGEYSEEQNLSNSMFDELTYYWVNHSSLVIDTHDTSIRSLSYCPLRMIAAEWSNYIELLGFGLKDGEIRQMGSVTTRNDLEHLDLTLSYLASWSRRVLSTKAKLRDAIDLIHTRPNTKPLTEDWTGLLDDYNHLDLKLSEYGKQLECNTGLLMSSVQLAESRQAFSEARNMSRLATLTLMFVPLNFVSSLFSMNDVVAPGTSLFWLYFAVAMPFLVVILFLMGSLTSFSWLSKRLVRRKPGNSLPF